jgi:hypothetical protein
VELIREAPDWLKNDTASDQEEFEYSDNSSGTWTIPEPEDVEYYFNKAVKW